MNKVFRVVWNETLGSWVVVSEMAKSKVKTQRIRLKKVISQIIVLSLTVIPASFVLADGIYINASDSNTCTYINSAGEIKPYTDTTTGRNCEPRNVNSQTNRILFYGEVSDNSTSSATTNLTVGGTTYVNSGSLGLGGAQASTAQEGAIRIGGGVAANTSLDNDGEVRQAAGTIGANSGMQSIAIGGGASNKEATIANEDYAIALGFKSQANAISSIAIGGSEGTLTRASADYAIALGTSVSASGESSIAMGNTTNASGISSVALGDNANASLDNSIALGANSITTESNGTGYLTNQAVTNTNVFSIGSDTLKRRIQNVADGAEDSDAVTVAQLRTVATAAEGGFGLTTENGEVKKDLGETIELVGADSNISTKVNNDQVEIELNKDLTGLNSIEVVDATDPTKKTTTTGAGTVVIDGDNTSTLAATGTTVTDGINTSVYGVNGVNINNGSVILNNAGLTVGDVTVGNSGIDAGGTQISGVGDATKDDQAVNLAQLKKVGKASEGNGFGLTTENGEVKKDLGEMIELVGADSNISTKVNNGQVEIELNKDLTGLNSVEVVDATDPTKKTTTTGAGTVVIDGDNTSTLAATGTTVTDGTNTGIYGANGININNGSVILNNTGLTVGDVTIGNSGIDAGNTQISGVADATAVDQAVNLGQLNNITEASTGGGFGLKAEDGSEVKQDLGKTIELVGADSNISTKVNNGQVEIELNKDLTGLNSVEVVDATDPTKKTTTTGAGTVVIDGDNTSTLAATGTTVTDGTNTSIYGANGININNGSVILNNTGLTIGNVVIGSNGINAGGNTISNVGIAENDDEAVNLGQLKDMIATGGTGGSGGIQYDDPTTKDSVTLGGENGTTISNLKDGTIAQGSTEAVNGGQIFDLQGNLQNQITTNTNDISNLQNQINNIDGNSLVQQATPDSDVTIAAGTGGKNVNVSGTDGDRKVTGVADGNISSTSTDAVNGSQLQENYDNVAAGLGGGAKYENGTWTGPEYTVGDTTVTNVGDAIDALNKSDQQLDSQLTNLSNKVDNMYIATNERIDRLEKDTNSGIASAIAIASLPQPTEKGYTMMSAGTGVWKGEVGLALGASGVTEDRVLFKKPVNYVWKFASTFDSRSNWGGGASVGVQWK